MKRTGQSKLAVVGWGRGMGHTGHMYLADAVIQQAKDMKADPYFFVSKTVGKDDPLFPEEKLKIYQTVFPQQKNIFTPQGNLNQALQELATLGYEGVVLVVGADQKESFKYLEKPNKEGIPVYQTFGFKKLRVISRQETRSQYRGEAGPRATPMRQVLLDPNATDEQKYQVWRRDMPSALSDDEVLDLMRKASERLAVTNKPKAARAKDLSAKIGKLKEAILSFRTQRPKPQQKPEPLGYKHMFKQPDEQKKPEEKRFHSWQEYAQDRQPETVEENRIIDPKALINAFYVSPQGNRHRVAEKIPYYLLDKLIPLLTKKYAITMNDIEVRPADVNQYRRTSQPELAEGLNSNPEAGDKITWYYSNQYPKIEGEVVGWKDGHLMVKSIDPSPRNTEKTVATYCVPANNILSIAKQGVDEAYDGFGKFDAAEFQRHMEKLRAREELRKTDPMKALVGDLKDQDAEKELAIARRKKPEDDSMSILDPRHPGAAYTQGNQNIDEVSDKTLMSYLTKVDADSRKHKMDPTKRDPKKASKSVSGFSKAFNKLDSRKPDGTVEEDKDPCWDGYQQIGMKEKNGKKVPNCVPTNEDYLDE